MRRPLSLCLAAALGACSAASGYDITSSGDAGGGGSVTTDRPSTPRDTGRNTPADIPAQPDPIVPPGGADAGPPQSYPGVPGVSPMLGGCPIFPPDNPWNRDISGAPLHPRSSAIIANIQAHGDGNLRADFGSNTEYGIPFTIAPASQSPVPIRFTEYPDESDPGPYPIPTDAAIEGGGDRHVLVVHSGSCRLFELYRASRSGSGWSASSGAVFDLRSNALRPQGWTSADQGGLPILAGLARYDEVAAGEIRHALRVTFEHTRSTWVHPATHWGGTDDRDAPPMGTRLRLRASYDISRLSGAARVIATALKRYGLMVADTGTNWFISGATDRRWSDNELVQLRMIPGTAFEVVNTGPERSR